MKKLIALLLATLLICTLFAACGDKPAADDDDNSKPASQSASSGEGSGEGNGEGAAKANFFKSKEIKTDAEGSSSIRFEWDQDNAKLYVYTISYAPASALGDKYEAPLSIVQKYTYSVDNRTSAEGGYAIDGALQSLKITMEGKSAAAYIEDNKEAMGDMYEALKNGTEFTGAELESELQRKEYKFEAIVNTNGENLVVNSFTELYTTYGDLAKHKDVMTFKNEVINKVEQYYNGELEIEINYDESGAPIVDEK
jgi:hypothetical protein